MATLLHYPLCAFSRSIRLALDECGIEAALAEERTWDWRPEFVALNPAGPLPGFITDEHGPRAPPPDRRRCGPGTRICAIISPISAISPRRGAGLPARP